MKLLIQVAADAAWNYDLVIHSSAWQIAKFIPAVCTLKLNTKHHTAKENCLALLHVNYKPVFVNIWIAPVKSMFTFSVDTNKSRTKQ